MTDFWESESATTNEEEEPTFAEVPARKFFACRNVGEEGAGAAPEVRTFTNRKTGTDFYKLNMGLVVRGGEASVDSRLNGRYVFANYFIHPRAEEGEEQQKRLAPRLVGVLNCLFSPGVGENLLAAKGSPKEAVDAGKKARSDARWANTLTALRAASEMHDLNPEQFKGDDGEVDAGVFFATCAAAELKANPRWLVTKTSENKRKTDEGVRIETVAGSVYDCTAAVLAQRKVELWDEEDRPELGDSF